jgi:hypothetical protein
LLFDDIPLGKIFKRDPEGLIHMLDRRNPTPIRVLYAVITIKEGTRVVITSNIPFDRLLTLHKTPSEQVDAIRRRVTVVEATEPFPLTTVTQENFQQLKDSPDVFHPN